MDASVLEDLLREAFPTADIMVDGADGVHMSAQIVAEEFKGKNRVAQQRMVYAALKGKMDGPNGELHALALTTKVKE
ncbi:MAG: BolA family transcriptional regulator [Amylibacter sp.]|nr:BolA family transcriptional regulator [Amylibacter sp.]